VWYAADVFEENEVMWEDVFEPQSAVDFFYSDRPLEAMQARDKLQKKPKS